MTLTPEIAASLLAVDRAMAEFRRGGLVLLHAEDGQAAVVQAAEGVSEGSLAALTSHAGAPPSLLLTRQRVTSLTRDAHVTAPEPRPSSATLGPPGSEVFALSSAALDAATIAELADPTARRPNRLADLGLLAAPLQYSGARLGVPAVALAKLARLLPAVLFADLGTIEAPEAQASSDGLLVVAASDITAYGHNAARSLHVVAEARVPLTEAENTRIVAFRPSDGGVEHLAIVIGEPDAGAPVLARLHSECFTGDLLGSLRCDCGDQLRGAIDAIAAAGTGVLLYLAQEGRGIGLVNKLRAYTLQDLGADTFEANEQLGFDADERIYLPAAEMLRQLGFHRVRLLSNNPEKAAGLDRSGIAVEEMVRHRFPSNGHNEFYIATKAVRGGHLF